MLKFNLQLFGGRGSSSSGGGGGSGGSTNGGRFKNADDFEKSLTGLDDTRLKEYQNGYDNIASEFGTYETIENVAKHEGLSDFSRKALEGDKKDLQKKLKNMPSMKSPQQLGEIEAIKDTIKKVDKILSIKPSGNKSFNPDDISITN